MKNKELIDIYKILSDESRFRIINILNQEELTVSEIQKILKVTQSGLSSNLALMRKANIVISRKEGKQVFYHIDSKIFCKEIEIILENSYKIAKKMTWYQRDKRLLSQIIQLRRENTLNYFNTKSNQNKRAPGQTWKLLFEGLRFLISGKKIADFGCGNGHLSFMLAKAGNDVFGIDDSKEQIKLANELYKNKKYLKGTSLKFLCQNMEKTTLKNNYLDIIIYSHSLHHVSRPNAALKEAHRILKKYGKIIILDIHKHEEEWMRNLYGDFWLGLDPNQIHQSLSKIGFNEIFYQILEPSKKSPEIEPMLIVAQKK